MPIPHVRAKHCSQLRSILLSLCLIVLQLLSAAASAQDKKNSTTPPIYNINKTQSERPLGLFTRFFNEQEAITLAKLVSSAPNNAQPNWLAALQLFATAPTQLIQTSRRNVLNFGIGAAPHWLELQVHNSSSTLDRQLLINTSWLDQIDVIHLDAQQQLLASFTAGDAQVFGARPKGQTGFSFSLQFPPGDSRLLLRIATADPMVLPIYLTSTSEYQAAAMKHYYSYGFSYGYLLALIAFNALLYFGLHDKNYLRYAIYLSAFTFMNFAYTGHGFAWIWPEGVTVQRWIQPIAMIAFIISGLSFALNFLDLRLHRPKLYRVTCAAIALALVALALSLLAQSQAAALLVAFCAASGYTLLMFIIGLAVYSKTNLVSRYYLYSAIVGIIGAVFTTFSTWGFIAFSEWTFRAIEFSMLLEATLLALALAARIRQTQKAQIIAEQLANTDPLTQLNNRRAFYLSATQLWSSSQRHHLPLSIISLDIDHFKHFNDTHGHAAGDYLLTLLSTFLLRSARQDDVVARWGGEEFLLLLPHTHASDALQLAERIKKELHQARFVWNEQVLNVSASFGVAERQDQDKTIDDLIARADAALYVAKRAGRNRAQLAL